MASEKQQDWIRNLAAKKNCDVNPEIRAYVDAVLNTPGHLASLDNNQFNEVLDWFKKLPWKSAQPTRPAVPTQPTQPAQPARSDAQLEAEEIAKELDAANKSTAGRYFITDPTDGVEKFVHVSIAVRASDDLYPIKDEAHREAIMREILKAPIDAMNEYGIRLGVCGNCGRTLTRRDSRLRGLGPICAERLSAIPTQEQLDTLKRLGLKKD